MVNGSSRERIRTITIPPAGLEGLLGLPTRARGIVLFAHCSGSGRFSLRNNFVAQALPIALGAIGFYYRDFHQMSDAEVTDLLARAPRPTESPANRAS